MSSGSTVYGVPIFICPCGVVCRRQERRSKRPEPQQTLRGYNMEYSQPRRRARAFGLGILTGNAIEGGNLLGDLQSNIQFRIQSARDMLAGGEQALAPGERRREIISRRREALLGSENGRSSDSSRSSSNRSRSTRSTSGRISDSGSSSSGGSSGNTRSSVPSMSDVNRGTKARAEERGFGA